MEYMLDACSFLHMRMLFINLRKECLMRDRHYTLPCLVWKMWELSGLWRPMKWIENRADSWLRAREKMNWVIAFQKKEVGKCTNYSYRGAKEGPQMSSTPPWAPEVRRLSLRGSVDLHNFTPTRKRPLPVLRYMYILIRISIPRSGHTYTSFWTTYLHLKRLLQHIYLNRKLILM